MEVSMTMAAAAAALSVLVGAFLGAFYDVIRFLRVVLGVNVSNPFKKGKMSPRAAFGYVFVSLTDLLFFAVAAVCMCVFFFLMGDGRMRGYGLVGAFLGFVLYYNTVGRLFIGALTRIISLLVRAVRFIFKPFARLFGIVKKICARFFKLPIVIAARKRYNDCKIKRKKRQPRAHA